MFKVPPATPNSGAVFPPSRPSQPPPSAPPVRPNFSSAVHSHGQALKRDEEFLRTVVDQMFAEERERLALSQASLPPSLTLDAVLRSPEKYRENPLEIVLCDVDGTTRRGQFWLEWAVLDLLRYGPKNITGTFGIRKLLRAVIGSLPLVFQDIKEGKVDQEKAKELLGPILKGMDAEGVLNSFRRFYDVFGQRHLSAFMGRELHYHQASGRLVLLVSASPKQLIQHHAADLGLPPENAAGSFFEVVSGKLTGAYELLREETKMVWLYANIFEPLNEAQIPFRVSHVYSDSRSDESMVAHTYERGGFVYLTNARNRAWEERAIRLYQAKVVSEKNRWFQEGVFRTTLYVSAGQNFVRNLKIPPQKPTELVEDIPHYAAHMFQAGVAYGLGFLGVDIFLNHVTSPPTTFDRVYHMVLAGAGAALGAGLGHVFVPKDNSASAQRRIAMEGMAPLASALLFAGGMPSYKHWALAYLFLPLTICFSSCVSEAVRATGAGISKGFGIGEPDPSFVKDMIGRGGLGGIQLIAFKLLNDLMAGR